MFPLSGISIRVSQSATGYRYLRGRVAARSKWARWRTETPPGGQVAPGAGIVFCSLGSWTGFNRGRSRSVPRLRRILSLSRWRCSGREEEESVGPWAERRLNGFNEPLRSSNRENQSWTGPNITIYVCPFVEDPPSVVLIYWATLDYCEKGDTKGSGDF